MLIWTLALASQGTEPVTQPPEIWNCWEGCFNLGGLEEGPRGGGIQAHEELLPSRQYSGAHSEAMERGWKLELLLEAILR